MQRERQKVLIVLPMFGQDGHDEYDGIMRAVRERKLDWDISLDRLAPTPFRPTLEDRARFTGAIINGWAPRELTDAYLRRRIPVAVIGWQTVPKSAARRRGLVHVSSVSEEIGRTAADTLLKTGHFASYAYLPTRLRHVWSVDRGRAFARQLKKRGHAVRTLDPSAPLGPQLKALAKPAAIFAAHDLTAERALAAARDAGIAIPQDASVLGVDNELLVCLHTNPPLASIQPDFEKAGYLAATALADLFGGQSPKRHQRYGVRQVVLRRSMEPARSAGNIVQRALELIRDPESSSHGIDWIARQLGISRRLLDQRFRQIRSKSVLEEILDVKIARVATMLKTTNLSIAEISAASRLGSGTYPQRIFKKRTGQTMREFRRSPAPCRSTPRH